MSLPSPRIGSEVVHLAEVGSTIDVARRLAEEGAVHGTVVVADRQTAGRGRFDRTWHTVAGRSIAATIVLRDLPEPERLPLAGMAAALAVVSAARSLLGVRLRTKWPNDVVCGGRKLAGTLAQRTAGVLLLSIGLNVNGKEHDLPRAIRDTAATLEMVAGGPVDLEAMKTALWRALDRTWRALLRDPTALLRRWERLDVTHGAGVADARSLGCTSQAERV
jgi:BirA family transcriptional regulator, biotin operon repressor / biotin---[acetyl-CoA-carboxylase] ligase